VANRRTGCIALVTASPATLQKCNIVPIVEPEFNKLPEGRKSAKMVECDAARGVGGPDQSQRGLRPPRKQFLVNRQSVSNYHKFHRTAFW
jgi:hypothetical protein